MPQEHPVFGDNMFGGNESHSERLFFGIFRRQVFFLEILNYKRTGNILTQKSVYIYPEIYSLFVFLEFAEANIKNIFVVCS
jgi:hypothetical protein